jgi:heme-degrading monooxygenase HmoA
MNIQRRDFLLLGSLTAAAATAASRSVLAQWSIGAPGKREAPAGLHRYVFLVFANPIPGKEVEFNEWYTNMHMGDLVQLQGFTGAQRFRIVTSVSPQPSAAGYEHRYLMVWDLEDTDANATLSRMAAAIAGGKSRRGAAFDYTPGAGASGTFEALGPRVTRPDGKGPTLPDASDNKTPRPDRYILMDFTNASPGKEAQFEESANQRIQAVLTLPGWMAAQRFRMVDTPGRPPSRKPRYLTMWETEGASAQAVHDVLVHAQKAGVVKENPAADENAAEKVYWEPITPHITKGDFVR